MHLEVLSTFAFLASCGSSSKSAISIILKEEKIIYHSFTDKNVLSGTEVSAPGNSLYTWYMYIQKKVIACIRIALQFVIKLHSLKINGSVYIGLVINTATIIFDFPKELTGIIKNNFL